jgi:CheY-like chemotaxis protein
VVDGVVRIDVADTGIGIPDDLLGRMFDMFTQGTQSRGQGGLGIGLTLARSLVDMHGGTLTATSAGEGRGSTFTVTLPLAAARLRRAPIALPAPVPAAPRRILVVDDNVDAAQSLEVLLRHMGHDVRIAHEGAAALGHARDFRPEVVFLDIALPGMSGYEVARSLRSTVEVNGTRIVALTGYSQKDDVRKSREAGCDLHLVKPVDADALTRALS